MSSSYSQGGGPIPQKDKAGELLTATPLAPAKHYRQIIT
jgi:hypothetical protein